MKLFNLLLLIPTIGFSQYQELKLTPNGVEPIVISIDTITAAHAYQRAKEWVERSYVDPEKVLKADIKNDMIRIHGFNEFGGGGYGFDYDMEVGFKDGRYRIIFNIGQMYVGDMQRTLFTYSTFYKTKDGSIRPAYQTAVQEMEKDMNEVNSMLYYYITGTAQKSNDDW